ncbi:hypothetical protein HDU81_004768 [Chytriomyces hyalinus]|nr:hypothetical protein HDU81_004768 [Chytriomyces hyalinus]
MSLRLAAQQFLTGTSPLAILSEAVQPTLGGNILVLDSSFNPPHETHLALITRSLKLLNTRSQHKANISRVILLHALNNADKSATSSLSALMPRLSLMDAFSRDVADCVNSSSEPPVSVLLALTTAAKFADKATLLRTTNAVSASQSVFWILGMDTVVRLFDQKYYSVPVLEALTPLFRNDAVVYAPRAGFMLPEEEEAGVFLEKGKIVAISGWDSEERKCSYSSTHVRNLLARLDCGSEVERMDVMNSLRECVPKHTLQRLLEIQKDSQESS